MFLRLRLRLRDGPTPFINLLILVTVSVAHCAPIALLLPHNLGVLHQPVHHELRLPAEKGHPKAIINSKNTVVDARRGQKYARMVSIRGAPYDNNPRINETTIATLNWYLYCISFGVISMV